MSDLLDQDPTVCHSPPPRPRFCLDTSEEQANLSQFLPEVWAFLVVGYSVLFLRFAVRVKTVGIRGFQGDDLLVAMVVLLYGFDAGSVYIICEPRGNRSADVLIDLMSTRLFGDECGSRGTASEQDAEPGRNCAV
jgi:hypothetical protein